MQEHEDVEEDVPVVGQPEGLEGVAAGVLGGKDKDHNGYEGEDEGAEAGGGEEEPEEEGGQVVAGEVDFAEDAAEVACRLRGDVVEVDPVTDDVHEGEEETRQRHYLVEGDVGIKGHVVVQRCLAEVGDEVTGHGDQEYRVCPHHPRGSPPRDCHTVTSNPPQTTALRFDGVVVRPLNEDPRGDEGVQREIEYVKAVVFDITLQHKELPRKVTGTAGQLRLHWYVIKPACVVGGVGMVRVTDRAVVCTDDGTASPGGGVLPLLMAATAFSWHCLLYVLFWHVQAAQVHTRAAKLCLVVRQENVEVLKGQLLLVLHKHGVDEGIHLFS